MDEENETPSPREEFEAHFGPIIDEEWQWLKEFCERNYIPQEGPLFRENSTGQFEAADFHWRTP